MRKGNPIALWPFGKNKSENSESESGEPTHAEDVNAPAADAEATAGLDDAVERGESEQTVTHGDAGEADAPAVVPHDAVGGSTGPFDGDNVSIEDFDFSDFAVGVLDLGSIKVALPKESQVQVEMGEQGPQMLHIITRHGRFTPVAFAAPNSGGLWEESSQEIAEGMRNDGMPAVFENGPWGREVVGKGEGGVIRVIGVEGPRWLYRVTLAAPHGEEDGMAELGREMVARSFVHRGSTPVLAGDALPVQLPAELAGQLQQAMMQAQQDAQAQQAVENGDAGTPDQR